MTTSHAPAAPSPGIAVPLSGLAAWSVLAAGLAAGCVFRALPMEVFAATVVASTLALTVLAFRHAGLRAAAARLGPYGLAGFHVWRVPAALMFFWYGAEGLLPPVFVLLAGVGDLIAGLAAGLVILARRSRARILAFHLFGLADFVVAVGTGLAFTLLAVPAMVTITTLPVALIPLVGVPVSGATHLVALHILLSRR